MVSWLKKNCSDIYIFLFIGILFLNIYIYNISNIHLAKLLYILVIIKAYLMSKLLKQVYINIDESEYKEENKNLIKFMFYFIINITWTFIITKFIYIFNPFNLVEKTELINFFESLIFLVQTVLILHQIIKKILEGNYAIVGFTLLLAYTIGWIGISHWKFISLVVVVINQLLDYDDAKLIYIKLNGENESIDESKTKSNFIILKLKINIVILLLYLFLAFTENTKLLESTYLIFNNTKSVPNLVRVIFKGTDRIFYIMIISLLFKKSKNIKDYLDKIMDYIKIKYQKIFINK